MDRPDAHRLWAPGDTSLETWRADVGARLQEVAAFIGAQVRFRIYRRLRREGDLHLVRDERHRSFKAGGPTGG